jgi:hypothetical protein
VAEAGGVIGPRRVLRVIGDFDAAAAVSKRSNRAAEYARKSRLTFWALRDPFRMRGVISEVCWVMREATKIWQLRGARVQELLAPVGKEQRSPHSSHHHHCRSNRDIVGLQ